MCCASANAYPPNSAFQNLQSPIQIPTLDNKADVLSVTFVSLFVSTHAPQLQQV